MYKAKPVRLEGMELPCLVLLHKDLIHHDKLPEELRVDLSGVSSHPALAQRGQVTYRLMPSSLEEDEPVYREIFQE